MGNLGKRKILLGILIPFILVIAVSCTSKEATDHKIVLRLGFFDDLRNRQLGQALADAFNKTHPSIQVRMIGLGGGSRYFNKLLTMIAGGAAPDVMVLSRSSMIDFVSRNVLLNLNPYMENDREFQSLRKDIYPFGLKASQYQNTFYSVPFWINSIVLFYNKDLFDKEGIPYPDGKWDWDKLVSVGQKLTKDINDDGRIDQYAFFDCNMYRVEGLYVYILRNGGQLFSEDESKCLIATPKSIEAIQWCFDLVNKYNITPSRFSGDSQLTDYEQCFFSGKVAMTISGRWSIPMRISVANSPTFLNKFSRPEDNYVFLKELEGEPMAADLSYFPGQQEWLQKSNMELELVMAGKKDLKTACKEIAQQYKKIKSQAGYLKEEDR